MEKILNWLCYNIYETVKERRDSYKLERVLSDAIVCGLAGKRDKIMVRKLLEKNKWDVEKTQRDLEAGII